MEFRYQGPEYHELYQAISDCTGICTNSKIIQAGECFFALRGATVDANIFIDEVLQKGAKFAITDSSQIKTDNKILYVDNALEALAYCAKKFYSPLPQYKLAVTGTNGKTSTTNYCSQILNLLGKPAASIGTIGVLSNVKTDLNISNLASLTSNDLVTNYKILNSLKISGVDYVALEASSIGLDQQRLNKLQFEAAAFTNFSSDHLDYHKNLVDYLTAKLKLFQGNLSENSSVFLSQDVVQIIRKFGMLNSIANYETIGTDPSCNLYIKSHTSNLNGQKVTFTYQHREYEFETAIIGGFQIYNLLFAILLTHSCGIDLNNIVTIVPKLRAVKGRLEKVEDPKKNRFIFVDYAHNPEALKKAILELKHIKTPQSRIFTLFGCGGDRDKSKRPIMGNIASELSDYVVITDDNPRFEPPEQIRLEIISGIKKNNYTEISNRSSAIKYILDIMDNYDILLVAGKGHEEYQIYKSTKIYFSDVDTITKHLV
jgi:UDP-N-acetylmuramyl-tripeptide synthetase